MVSGGISAEPETKADGVLTIKSSVLYVYMFDCGGNVIVIGHVQLHHINGSAASPLTELLDRFLALLDVSRAENVHVGGITFAGNFNDGEA